MTREQPFQHLFESFGRLPQAHAEGINQPAYQALLETLSVPLEQACRGILLRAPRAGYGKTHLLCRLQHHLASGHEFIPLHPTTDCRVDAVSVTADILRRLGRQLPAAGGLCALDLIARRLFALALQPLVGSGEVPCLDRESALASLRYRPVETFDFHHPNANTAHWIRENFEVLGPRLAQELAQLTGASPRAVDFWVDAMFRFAATPVHTPGRNDALAQASVLASPGDGMAMERLAALLALLSLLVRVVLVADDLEGFSADETAALRLAAFLSDLRQAADRVDVILALNRDVWDSAFLPRLSGGLVDRLSEVVIELEPLTEAQMVALLESRTPGQGTRVLDSMRPAGLEPYARGLLRAAGAAWARAPQEVPPAPAPPVMPVPLAEPPPAPPVMPVPLAEPAPAPATVPPAVPVTSAASELPTPPFERAPESPMWQTPLATEPPPPPQFSPLAPEAASVPQARGFEIPPEAPAQAPPAAAAENASSPFHPEQEPPVPAFDDEMADPTASPPPPIDQDRVEDLLRQFRERYNRPTP